MSRLCLVTPGHLASTPRLVKAADALAAAGYHVHVVTGRHFPPAEPLDAAILARRAWTCERVVTHAGLAGLIRRIRRRLARHWLATHPAARRFAAQAHHAGHAALVAAAVRARADFYYGHGGVAGLAAAAAAAQRRRTAYGFDVEDWHEAENDAVLHDPAERTAVHTLLGTLLPRARLLTCAAPLIGEALGRRYGVETVCLLNVFPLAEAPANPVAVPPPSPATPAVLYWFSQTIGPGRGLEWIIEVLGRMRTPVELHLRGFVTPAYRADLGARAGAARFGGRMTFLSPGAPAEMARLAADAHLGLSLEQSAPRNRDLCLTNKIFAYLLAGVPVAMTPTAAQRALAPDLGAAAILLDPDATAAAAALDRWFESSERIRDSHTAAWQRAQTCYNWDREQQKLLTALARLTGATP